MIAGILALIVTALTATNTFLKQPDNVAKHLAGARRYAGVAERAYKLELEIRAELGPEPTERSELRPGTRKQVADLQDEFRRAQDEFPSLAT